MKALRHEAYTAVMAALWLGVVSCGLYPLTVFVIGQWIFPWAANGSLLRDAQGTVRGSRLLGQPFRNAKYFHPRPSAAGDGYDAANSGGSNLGPTSRKLQQAVSERVAAYRTENEIPVAESVPADAVTASGSGLDPHISPRNAALQLRRVARARGLDEARVRQLVAEHTDPPGWGFLGDPGVNVLALNLALDAL